MEKTRRHSPENDYEVTDHRISRQRVDELDRLATRPWERQLPKVKLPEPSEGPEPRVVPGWVPSRIAGRTPLELHIREQRLSLLEEIGGHVLSLTNGNT